MVRVRSVRPGQKKAIVPNTMPAMPRSKSSHQFSASERRRARPANGTWSSLGVLIEVMVFLLKSGNRLGRFGILEAAAVRRPPPQRSLVGVLEARTRL